MLIGRSPESHPMLMGRIARDTPFHHSVDRLLFHYGNNARTCGSSTRISSSSQRIVARSTYLPGITQHLKIIPSIPDISSGATRVRPNSISLIYRPVLIDISLLSFSRDGSKGTRYQTIRIQRSQERFNGTKMRRRQLLIAQ